MSTVRLLDAELLLERRDLAAAVRAFDAAEMCGVDPDRCAAGRWRSHMLAGSFAAAWRESDAIRMRGGLDPHRFWKGEDPRGKRVIVRCLHGLGDAVQFLRYASQVRELDPHFIMEVPPPLLQLARCFRSVGNLISWGSHAPACPVEWDIQVEIMELPYLFRTELHELPLATKYLEVPFPVKMRVSQAMGFAEVPRVGVVWSAGEWNPVRSLPFAQMRRMLQDLDCQFWNLQGGPARDDWKAMPACSRVRDAAECGDGILTLAALVCELDLVITVDTLAAHIAGALGKPAWVLLQYAADWRWMTDRSDSPWYPSMRLFRQATPGDWNGVISSVQDRLKRWLQTAPMTGLVS
jgi:hypothetical protein